MPFQAWLWLNPFKVGFATDVAGIAWGRGDPVTVAGLSGGGTVATWLAQERRTYNTS